jgi:hypothetical protein
MMGRVSAAFARLSTTVRRISGTEIASMRAAGRNTQRKDVDHMAAKAKAKAKPAPEVDDQDTEEDQPAEDESQDDVQPEEPQDDENGGKGNGGGDLDLSVKKDFIQAKIARDGNEADTFRRIADLVEGWDG